MVEIRKERHSYIDNSGPMWVKVEYRVIDPLRRSDRPPSEREEGEGDAWSETRRSES